MKAIVQRINMASVIADGEQSGTAKKGLLVLLGVYDQDTEQHAELLARKVCNLRIFVDQDDKMNLSVLDVGGSVLTVSNFTLCADTKKGNRPSFINAKAPNEANMLYKKFMEYIKINGVSDSQSGSFGADMKITTELNGPVTIILDTDTWIKK
jgi:D-tyrosyl-tRNA(Tyr) deacylase